MLKLPSEFDEQQATDIISKYLPTNFKITNVTTELYSVEKPGDHYLNKVIQVDIPRNGTNITCLLIEALKTT